MGRTRTHKGIEYTVSEAHPAADAFPWLDESEIQELADDIKRHRQEYKVVRLPDGRVIDGRNRELACRIAGVEPQYRIEDMSDDEVVDFVVSANVHRRNLSASQRAMAAAELANMKRGEHKIQMGTGAHLDADALKIKSSVAEAAQKLDVSERSVKSAKKVKEKAPEIGERVKAGDIDVKTAAKAADLPKRERKRIAEAVDPKAAAKQALAKAEAKKQENEPTSPQLTVVATDADATDPDEPITQPEVDEGYEFVCGVESLCREMDQIAARMKALKASRFSHSIHVDSAVSQVEAARKTLWQGRPSHTCPYCGSDINPACRACKGTGRVKRTTFDSGSAAMGGAAA